ncbi:sulfatase-like hydrolase/transferase [Rubripirellula amarantea]|uniref:sulfatase-like hydrolase/transferase n=1 Tax=Rubripirellula amarantea TaxID=2527999 RepID=UPI0013EF578D|nr:sulfatase-like hydrolase/transferase [Rubripirellula amarantea]
MPKAEAQRPNILILIGDDIDRDSLSPWGGQAHTPNLDQLARDGIRLDRAYVNVAMCAPCRQELYSGRTAWRTRAMPNHSKSVAGTRSLPHYLQPLGYHVGLLGKKHIGPRDAYPFDNVGELPMKENPNPKAVRLATRYMTAARDAGNPFCLVVASHDGHSPYTHGASDRYNTNELDVADDAIDTPIYRNSLAKHLAEVTNLDDLLGELRLVLQQEGLADNTLVLFCSEQGNAFPFSKWTCFDGGLATGIVAALPSVIPAGKSNDQIVWLSDIVPTLIEAVGEHPSESDFDGRSQWANFTGGDQAVHEYAFGAFSNCNIIDNRERIFPIRSIRDRRFTLIWSPLHASGITSNVTLSQALEWVQNDDATMQNADVAGSWVAKTKMTQHPQHIKLTRRLHHRPEWALYDRDADSNELRNLIDEPEFADIASELKRELMSWLNHWEDSDPVATEQGFINAK